METTGRRATGRRWGWNLLTLLGGVGAIVLACYIASSRTVPFDEYARKIGSTTSFSCDLQQMGMGGPWKGKFYAEGGRGREELPYSTFVTNFPGGSVLRLAPASRQAFLTQGQSNERLLDLYGLVEEAGHIAAHYMGESTVDGKKVFVIGWAPATPWSDQRVGTWMFWIDPQTQLPVRMEVHYSPSISLALTNIRFNVPLSDSLFDLSAPANYAFTTNSSWGIQQTSRQPLDFTLIPRQGMRAIKLGTAQETVRAQIGTREQGDETHWLYPSQGFGLVMSPMRTVQEIICYGNGAAASMGGVPYPGLTENGVGINTARANVEFSYGKNEKISTDADGLEVLTYEAWGLRFTMISGHVENIRLWDPKDKSANPSTTEPINPPSPAGN